MEMEIFLEKLCRTVGEQGVKRDEPMKKHTTFRIGGPADIFITPEDESQFLAAVRLCRQEGMPYYILGNGSNLLVSDSGYRGAVIETEKALSRLEADGETLKAGAGILLSVLAKEALRLSLTGLESASGIPGTLGGGVVMNAGAYGFELKDVLESVRLLDREGNVRTVPAGELKLGYRYSTIPETGSIVLEAALRLKKGDPEAIRARMEELAAQRKSKQPLETAGRIFCRKADRRRGFERLSGRRSAGFGKTLRFCDKPGRRYGGRRDGTVPSGTGKSFSKVRRKDGYGDPEAGNVIGGKDEACDRYRDVRRRQDNCTEDIGRSGFLLRG